MLPWANRTENSTRVVVRHSSGSALVGCTTSEECALRKIAMVAFTDVHYLRTGRFLDG